MTCSCLWIRGAPEYPWPDFETGASAINRPLHTAGVGDKHMRAHPVAQTSLMNTHRSYVHLHIFYYYSSCASERFTRILFCFCHVHEQKPTSLVSKSQAHQTQICPQMVPAGFVCSGQAVPREKTCVCVPKQNLGYNWDYCIILWMLCNKTYREGC